jgi:hypothetical protein
VCSGNTLSFSINDQMVKSLTDKNVDLTYGRAGIYTKSGGDPNEDAIVFSNLVIKQAE